jgi:hypothetical protein
MRTILTVVLAIVLCAAVAAAGAPQSSVSRPRGLNKTATIPFPSSNLTLWLRADSGVTETSGAVSGWADISGNAHHAGQATESDRPVVQSNQINGRSVIHFNNASSITLPTAADLGLQNSNYECFIVARATTDSIKFLLAGSSISNYELHLNLNTYGNAGARFIPNPDVGLNQNDNEAYSNGSAHVFNVQAHSGGGLVRVDAVNGYSSVSDCRSSDAGALMLGRRGDGTYQLNGDIAEVIIYTSILSSGDRNTVEMYLAGRYGITSGALPVELTSFSANRIGQNVTLNWNTATEVNNAGFGVERKEKGSSALWSEIGFIEGHGTTNAPQSYAFIDASAEGSVRYRLRQVDRDGAVHYSGEVEVAAAVAPAELFLGQNYPNPFNPSTMISFTVPVTGYASLTVYDAVGRMVSVLADGIFESGTRYERQFDASSLAAGLYFARLSVVGSSQVRKMLLVK